MTTPKRRRWGIVALSVALAAALLLGCVDDPGGGNGGGNGDNWDGMDRSGWAWDGSQGSDPVGTVVAGEMARHPEAVPEGADEGGGQ